MKLHFALAASAAVLFAAAAPVSAAPGTHIIIGEHPAEGCANAADALARDRMLAVDVHDGLALCNEALNGSLSENNRTATLVNRGALEAAFNQTDAAIADFNAALARNPGLSDVYVNRGAALLRAGHFDQARADFDHAIAAHASATVVAYFDRGMANEKSGDLKAAYRDYSQAASMAPGFEPAKAELARFHVQNNYVASR
jgi:tetratricopeptide (TPR) repeat protein